MKVLGIIPARGGSKGVPRKNLRLVDGQPLISYSIQKAKESKLLTNIIVSSDSDEIIKVSKEYQCESLKRCDENAQDDSKIEITILEVINSLSSKLFNGMSLGKKPVKVSKLKRP